MTDAATLTDLQARAAHLPPASPQTLADRDDAREALSQQMLADARAEDARQRYVAACPDSMRASDWSFPALQPFRRHIGRVLEYRIGQKGLLASGPTGRGKSRALWSLMCRLALDEGREVRFFTAYEFFAIIGEQVRYGTDEARGWVDTVARRPIVFIDDYGQEALLRSREDWARQLFFRFLDVRGGAQLPLFITTNMTGAEIAESRNLRGDPLLRRLLLVCDAVPFETDEERDARRKRR